MVKKLDKPPYRDTSTWLTPKEVATILKYKRTDRVYALIDDDEFEVFDRGDRSFLISPESLAAFQRRRIIASKKREQAPAESQLPAGERGYV